MANTDWQQDNDFMICTIDFVTLKWYRTASYSCRRNQ